MASDHESVKIRFVVERVNVANRSGTIDHQHLFGGHLKVRLPAGVRIVRHRYQGESVRAVWLASEASSSSRASNCDKGNRPQRHAGLAEETLDDRAVIDRWSKAFLGSVIHVMEECEFVGVDQSPAQQFEALTLGKLDRDALRSSGSAGGIATARKQRSTWDFSWYHLPRLLLVPPTASIASTTKSLFIRFSACRGVVETGRFARI